MLSKEAKNLWGNTRQRLEDVGTDITWDVFKERFLEKYFPADVHNLKEIEFFELKHRNMYVADYTTKFEELSRYYTTTLMWMLNVQNV